ncbi:hypothetical protein CFP65_0362 [Kitasatospora sp. MMS16-BH015]|uniref:hypothetical protein n=1 Tax=Kitasatospora sp. MMS16-BH015 TaxID=2018025 RepID=UPI000CA161D0|nr:hypothetical protein [Kitasatospora sp. MMS16-BH015]AUG75333.1 hypothetical protein CFP65_0362 [Kitasatospora sp. MMS16-BH015]
MQNGDPASGQDRADDDARWNVTLDDDFVKAATIKEANLRRPAADRPRKRVRPRNLALALGAAALAFVAFELTWPSSDRATARPVPAASASASAARSATPTASATAATAGRPQVPLGQAFPAEVKSASGARYTKVAAATLPSCTEPDSVGPRLIALIKEGGGCVGEQVALYKDAENDQFNLAVFTMKDPAGTAHLVTGLTMAFDDFEVGAQAPPPTAGLRTLPPDSGMVQAFAGSGRAMIVGLGQWSDGRSTDRQALVDRLRPLQAEVERTVTAYESQG